MKLLLCVSYHYMFHRKITPVKKVAGKYCHKISSLSVFLFKFWGIGF